jgi:hypothetical protein
MSYPISSVEVFVISQVSRAISFPEVLGRQEEDEPIPQGVARRGEVGQHGIDLAFGQRLGLLRQSHFIP